MTGRKARVEGGVAAEAVNAAVRKVVAETVSSVGGAPLASIRDDFIACFPAEWEAMRLYPLQHGIDAMIEKLKG